MRDFKKHIWKTLAILGMFLVVGAVEAQAVEPVTIAVVSIVGSILGISLFGGAIKDVALGVMEGLTKLLDIIIQAVASLLLEISTYVVEFAFAMNNVLGDSKIIQDGFNISLSVANIGLFLGLVVLAIAIMLRANWIVDAKKAIPKFIAAALLVNFGYFITVNLLIEPVNKVTESVYRAASFNAETFRGPFQPDLNINEDLETLIKVSDKPDLQGKTVRFIGSRNQVLMGIERVLLEEADPRLPAGVVISPEQKNVVAKEVSNVYGYWLGRPAKPGPGFFSLPGTHLNHLIGQLTGNDGSREPTWDTEEFKDLISSALEAGDSVYGDFLSQSDRDLVANKMIPAIAEPVIDYFGCDITNYSSSSDNCDEYQSLWIAILSSELSSEQSLVITLIETIFNAVFALLGAFTLFGLGVMLVIRFVALSFLIILFPFTWLGWIFPNLSTGGGNIWSSWWSEFIRWLLFGPLSFFFVYLAIQLSLSMDEIVINENFASYGPGALLGMQAGNAVTIIGMLIGGLYVANKMSITGSSMFMNGMKRMQGWAKKGAMLPFTNRFTKRGWENAKLAGRAKGLQFVSDKLDLSSKKGRERTQELSASKNWFDRKRGARRAKRAARTEEFQREYYRRKGQYRDSKGELKDIPGGFRDSDRLKGLLLNARGLEEIKDDKGNVIGHRRVGRSTNRYDGEIAALAQKLHEDGFEWEGPLAEAAGYMKSNDLYRKFGMQKMENNLMPKGLDSDVMEVLTNGPQDGETEEEFEARVYEKIKEKYGQLADKDINFESKLFGDKAFYGMSDEEHAVYGKLITKYITDDRTSLLPKHLRKLGEDGQRRVGVGVEESLAELEQTYFGDLAETDGILTRGDGEPIRGVGARDVRFKESSLRDRLLWLSDRPQVIANQLGVADLDDPRVLEEMNRIQTKLRDLEQGRRGGFSQYYPSG